jgi:hypothetical protein
VVANSHFSLELVRQTKRILVLLIVLQQHVLHFLFQSLQNALLSLLELLVLAKSLLQLLAFLLKFFVDAMNSLNFATLLQEEVCERVFLVLAQVAVLQKLSKGSRVSLHELSLFFVSVLAVVQIEVLQDQTVSEACVLTKQL